MKEIIQDIIEIDKETREIITKIQEEIEKIPDFLHAEKERISLEKRIEAEHLIESRKREIALDLDRRLKLSTKEYNDSKKNINIVFDKYRKEWIEEIYKYCISE